LGAFNEQWELIPAGHPRHNNTKSQLDLLYLVVHFLITRGRHRTDGVTAVQLHDTWQVNRVLCNRRALLVVRLVIIWLLTTYGFVLPMLPL